MRKAVVLPKVYAVVFAIAVALGIFVLPWYVPMGQPTFSVSYVYGFNNRAAVSVIGGALLLFGSKKSG